jgi:hypothetical protein
MLAAAVRAVEVNTRFGSTHTGADGALTQVYLPLSHKQQDWDNIAFNADHGK